MVFDVKNDIKSVISETEKFLSYLKEIQKQKGNAVLNPNYVNLLNKLFNSPDIMMYKR